MQCRACWLLLSGMLMVAAVGCGSDDGETATEGEGEGGEGEGAGTEGEGEGTEGEGEGTEGEGEGSEGEGEGSEGEGEGSEGEGEGEGSEGEGEGAADPGTLVINEVDYDQESVDATEFIELYNPTAAAVPLAELRLVLVNGASATVYLTLELGGGELPPGGYLIAKADGFLEPTDACFRSIPLGGSSRVQNGPDDGILLVDLAAGRVVDAVGYEGCSEPVVIEGLPDPVVACEGGGFPEADTGDPEVLARIPDGQDTDDNSVDFVLSPVATPCAPNRVEPLEGEGEGEGATEGEGEGEGATEGEGEGEGATAGEGEGEGATAGEGEGEGGTEGEGEGEGAAAGEGEGEGAAVPVPLPGFGAISGECGVLDAELLAPEGAIVVNHLDFGLDPYDEADFPLLTAGGQEIIRDGNAGGSSLLSEVFAYEVLHRCELAQLIKTETEIRYDAPDSSIADLLVEIDTLKIGVSVTRAVVWPRDAAYTADAARTLLQRKLAGIAESTAHVSAEDAWSKEILSLLAYNDQHAAIVTQVWQALDPAERGDTILLLTVTDGDDAFIY